MKWRLNYNTSYWCNVNKGNISTRKILQNAWFFMRMSNFEKVFERSWFFGKINKKMFLKMFLHSYHFVQAKSVETEILTKGKERNVSIALSNYFWTKLAGFIRDHLKSSFAFALYHLSMRKKSLWTRKFWNDVYYIQHLIATMKCRDNNNIILDIKYK